MRYVLSHYHHQYYLNIKYNRINTYLRDVLTTHIDDKHDDEPHKVIDAAFATLFLNILQVHKPKHKNGIYILKPITSPSELSYYFYDRRLSSRIVHRCYDSAVPVCV